MISGNFCCLFGEKPKPEGKLLLDLNSNFQEESLNLRSPGKVQINSQNLNIILK